MPQIKPQKQQFQQSSSHAESQSGHTESPDFWVKQDQPSLTQTRHLQPEEEEEEKLLPHTARACEITTLLGPSIAYCRTSYKCTVLAEDNLPKHPPIAQPTQVYAAAALPGKYYSH